MPNYRRAFQPGGTFFLTLVTEDRCPIFAEEPARAILRVALERSRYFHPFDLEAIVLLPDHLHMVIKLPEGDSNYSIRITNLKSNFTRRYLIAGGAEADRSDARIHQETRGVWQRRFWEHTIADREDLNNHFDYIHYNPVKHGYVRCAHEWPYSSFRRFVSEGRYEQNWCCCCEGRVAHPPKIQAIEEHAGE